MARDPGSLWSPLPEAASQGVYAKDKFIVHSTGDRGTAANTYRYFNGPTPNESTFIVGAGPEDPTLQLLDSSARADANIAANKPGISVEVVGTGDDPYTDWQIAELIRLGVWSHIVHGIRPQVIPTPDGAGYGWHVMFGAPGPWTSVAKVCPGDKRIQTLTGVIFPAIFGATAPAATIPESQEDDDMPFLIRSSQGAVHLILGDRNIPVRDGKDYAELQAKGVKSANLSDALFAEIVASTGAGA